MSFFNSNICQFEACGKLFASLHDLIVHIEGTHIDFDAKSEEKPHLNQLVHMSSILRYSDGFSNEKQIQDNKIDEERNIIENPAGSGSKEIKIKEEIKEEPLQEDYEDFSTTSNEVKTEQVSPAKKFCCPITGCTKSYKNNNGMKYHLLNYHDSFGNLVKPKKEFKCHQCSKEYKTLRGLQSHAANHKETSSVAQQNFANLKNPASASASVVNPFFQNGQNRKLFAGNSNVFNAPSSSTLQSYLDCNNRSDNNLYAATVSANAFNGNFTASNYYDTYNQMYHNVNYPAANYNSFNSGGNFYKNKTFVNCSSNYQSINAAPTANGNNNNYENLTFYTERRQNATTD